MQLEGFKGYMARNQDTILGSVFGFEIQNNPKQIFVSEQVNSLLKNSKWNDAWYLAESFIDQPYQKKVLQGHCSKLLRMKKSYLKPSIPIK